MTIFSRFPLAAAAVAMLLAAPQTALTQTEPQPALRPVKLAVVEAGTQEITRQFFGKVVARRTVDLAFQVAGQIERFPVVEGTHIEEGALIAQLDLRPFELSLDQAQLQKEQADRSLDRLNKLRGSTVSESALDDSETQAGLARIEVDNAQIALDDATLYAPFDALVASRMVENYTTISAGTPVVRLHDMSEIRVEIDVPEVLIQKADVADDVSVLARFPASSESYEMTVRELNAETSAIGQTYRATFGMAPPEGLDVLPGSSVTVTAKLSRGEPRITIPAAAVQIAPDGATFVFRFDPKGAAEGTLTRLPVTVEPTDDGGVAVIEGLEDGDEIVVAGVSDLSDGMKARRFVGFGE
ncbi:efflux RND transporter periplasmic adaptor subunit [Salipiger sp.]|uniref:efflux RND transporter periplasmic adaptor subunit n=1 Tax=Salipiger sp. TaxID=2078585 RepID=UPI003A98860C